MTLHWLHIMRHHFRQCVERYVAYVVVFVGEEFAENVDGQHFQARLWFNCHNGLYGFVKNGVANVARCFGVGCDLSCGENKSRLSEIFSKCEMKNKYLFTCAKTSFIASLALLSRAPNILNNFNIRTCFYIKFELIKRKERKYYFFQFFFKK